MMRCIEGGERMMPGECVSHAGPRAEAGCRCEGHRYPQLYPRKEHRSQRYSLGSNSACSLVSKVYIQGSSVSFHHPSSPFCQWQSLTPRSGRASGGCEKELIGKRITAAANAIIALEPQLTAWDEVSAARNNRHKQLTGRTRARGSGSRRRRVEQTRYWGGRARCLYICGDGDCGITMKRGATQVLADLKTYPTDAANVMASVADS
eukprot:1009443-Rhodomonas_salina.1